MDWVALLTDHDIPYVTRGSNTKRGEVSIQCPFCGDDDPSQHLGISLSTENWGCLRSAQHRGHAPHTLIQALLGCSFAQAKLTVAAYKQADPGALEGAIAMLTPTSGHPRGIAGPLPCVALPLECQTIKNSGSTARFWRYLKGRHFDDVDDLVARYHLTCALTGVQKDRIVVPLRQKGALVGWTGRAIQPTVSAPRYLSSGEAVKRVVFNEDELKDGGKILFIVEGPFDALKLDYYGEPLGVRSTCIFGVSMTTEQLCTLRQLRRCYKKTIILLDQAAVEPAFDALDWLAGPNVSIGTLADRWKDPGEMKGEDVEQLIKEHLHE